jgi:hypothetical protein
MTAAIRLTHTIHLYLVASSFSACSSYLEFSDLDTEASLRACGDRIDNDFDGSIDCADTGCTGFIGEVCGDGLDNDLDGLTDGKDSECWPSTPSFRCSSSLGVEIERGPLTVDGIWSETSILTGDLPLEVTVEVSSLAEEVALIFVGAAAGADSAPGRLEVRYELAGDPRVRMELPNGIRDEGDINEAVLQDGPKELFFMFQRREISFGLRLRDAESTVRLSRPTGWRSTVPLTFEIESLGTTKVDNLVLRRAGSDPCGIPSPPMVDSLVSEVYSAARDEGGDCVLMGSADREVMKAYRVGGASGAPVSWEESADLAAQFPSWYAPRLTHAPDAGRFWGAATRVAEDDTSTGLVGITSEDCESFHEAPLRLDPDASRRLEFPGVRGRVIGYWRETGSGLHNMIVLADAERRPPYVWLTAPSEATNGGPGEFSFFSELPSISSPLSAPSLEVTAVGNALLSTAPTTFLGTAGWSQLQRPIPGSSDGPVACSFDAWASALGRTQSPNPSLPPSGVLGTFDALSVEQAVLGLPPEIHDGSVARRDELTIRIYYSGRSCSGCPPRVGFGGFIQSLTETRGLAE